MELRGALRISKFQKNATQPKYYGSAEIAGKMYELKGWEKTDQYGRPWISILFEDPGEEFAPEPKTRKQTSPDLGDLDDDIPF